MHTLAAFAPASLPQWIQAILQIFTLIVSMVALAIAYATFRRGSPANSIQSAQPQDAAAQPQRVTVRQRFRDIIRLFTVRDFWPQFVIFALASVSLFAHAISSEPVTRFAVLLMVLSGFLALICLAWLMFRARMFFLAVDFEREWRAKYGSHP